MEVHKQLLIDSPIGQHNPDNDGAPIGVTRLNPEQSYSGIGELLQEYIQNSDPEVWEKIRRKIDYTFEILGLALEPLRNETDFHIEIKSRIERGQKLLFKPNIVNPLNIDQHSHGPGMGSRSGHPAGNPPEPYAAARRYTSFRTRRTDATDGRIP